jgi:uncharacterized protein YigA (DUF484 family)
MAVVSLVAVQMERLRLQKQRLSVSYNELSKMHGSYLPAAIRNSTNLFTAN